MRAAKNGFHDALSMHISYALSYKFNLEAAPFNKTS